MSHVSPRYTVRFLEQLSGITFWVWRGKRTFGAGAAMVVATRDRVTAEMKLAQANIVEGFIVEGFIVKEDGTKECCGSGRRLEGTRCFH